MSFPTNAHYSLTWARSIVKRMREKYTRATNILEQVYAIDDETLAHFLASNDSMWNYLRDRVKKIADLANRLGYYYTDVKVYWDWERAAVKYTASMLAGRVDKGLKRSRIEEWGKTGGDGEAKPIRPPSLLWQFLLPFDGVEGREAVDRMGNSKEQASRRPAKASETRGQNPRGEL